MGVEVETDNVERRAARPERDRPEPRDAETPGEARDL